MAIKDDLRAALRQAMKDRDDSAKSAVRSALAALDNAEAVPMDTMPAAGATEAAAVGVGAADAARRELTEDECRAIVQSEVDERRMAATEFASIDADRATRLHREADILAALLTGLAAP